MVTTAEKVGCGFSLLTARQQGVFGASRSDESSASEQAQIQQSVEAKRSDLRNGLTRRQRTFILEKLVGLNDKDAALAAGYSLSVAENTKQRVWKPRVRAEWERLRCDVATRIHKQLEVAQFFNTEYNKEFDKEFPVGATVQGGL